MRIIVRALLFSMIVTAATAVAANSGGWVNLGSLHVSDSRDRDKLKIGVDRGRFKAVRLGAKGHAVQFHDVKIHFENGDVQDVNIRSVVRAGAWTRAIDLHGGGRVIKKIVLVYDAETARRGSGAVVLVRGRR